MPATPLLRWPLTPPAITCRGLLQIPAALLLDRVVPIEVEGADVFRDLSGPCLLAANHASHLDTAVVLRALPRGRRRVAVAAAADYFFANPLLGALAALAVNAFPLPRRGCPRSACRHCAWLIDRGWSILVFPEGTRSVDGRIGRFRPGIGWLAATLGRPVVPIHLAGLRDVLPKHGHLPRPGHVRVRFGQPLHFDRDVPPTVATAAVEDAVRLLACEHGGGQPERRPSTVPRANGRRNPTGPLGDQASSFALGAFRDTGDRKQGTTAATVGTPLSPAGSVVCAGEGR